MYYLFMVNNNTIKSLNNDLLSFSKSINSIFTNIDKDISDLIYKTSKIKTRNSKLSFSDVLYYKFLYSYKHYTKDHIVSKFNFDNDTSN